VLLTSLLATATWARARLRLDEVGEGVVSAAIAVLVMAFLGAAMYVGFKATLGKAQTKTDDQVSCIGSSGPSCPGATSTP
jgi:hypothetical protein